MKRFFRNTRGTVLLEVILTMPLHMLLMLSVAWLGQVDVDHLYVTEMDLAMAVTQGNRNAGTDDYLALYKSMYFESGAPVTVAQNIVDEAPATWWRKSSSRVKLTQEVPSWVKGIDGIIKYSLGLKRIDNGYYSTITDYETDDMTMVAQGAASGSAATTTAVMRNGAYAVDRENTTDWKSVVVEAYPDSTLPADITGKTVYTISAYTRNSQFAAWSE